jgi:hypothetical protein
METNPLLPDRIHSSIPLHPHSIPSAMRPSPSCAGVGAMYLNFQKCEAINLFFFKNYPSPGIFVTVI